jgi:hypothetical protein
MIGLAERRVGVDRERHVVEERRHLQSASAASLIMVLASGPTMCTPEHLLACFLSATTFTKPSVSLSAMALPSAAKGNFPIATSYALGFFASTSVRPTVAISGSVKMAPGIATQSNAALWPAMISATTSPSLRGLVGEHRRPR